MKQLSVLLFLAFIFNYCIAQRPPAEARIFAGSQTVFLDMQGIKKAKIIYIRETTYDADSLHKTDKKKPPYNIRVSSIGYFKDTPLLVQQLEVLGKDTTKLVAKRAFNYDVNTGLLAAYQVISDDVISYAEFGEAKRNEKGDITEILYGYSEDVNKAPEPRRYEVHTITDGNNNITSAAFKDIAKNRDAKHDFTFRYDNNNNLIYVLDNDSNKTIWEITYTYNSRNQVTNCKEILKYESEDLIEETNGIRFEMRPHTTEFVTENEYDKQGNLIKYKSYHDGKLTGTFEFIYNAEGIPITENFYDEKGLLKSTCVISCR